MKKNIIFSALIVCTCCASLCAQQILPLTKVTIFKNATAMMVREGSLPLQNGTVALPIPGQVRFGAFFIGSNKDNAVKSILFRNDTLRKPTMAKSVWQYLAANLNKQVSISYAPAEGLDKTLSGKITALDQSSGMLHLTGENGRHTVLHSGSIYAADFKEEPATRYIADSVERIMLLKPEKAASEIRLQEIYLTGGVNWMPSYFLKLKDDKNARIEMKATIENFAESIQDAEVELVVGAPQMRYSAKADPMTYDYLTVSVNDGAAYVGNYMQSNTRMAMAKDEDSGAYFEEDFSTQGEKSGDTYIYKPGKITLPHAAKGAFPIFAANIEYADKYEGVITDFTNYFSNRFCPQEDQLFDVFHSLELKNTSGMPLTTASVMVVNAKDQFVAQDEIKYTPVAATSGIRLSKAVDIIMKNAEEEDARFDNAKRVGKMNYSRVVLKGQVTLDNYQEKEVKVSVKKMVTGTVIDISNGGKSVKNNSYNYINPSSEIKWDITLAPGDKKVVTYTYEVFFTP